MLCDMAVKKDHGCQLCGVLGFFTRGLTKSVSQILAWQVKWSIFQKLYFLELLLDGSIYRENIIHIGNAYGFDGSKNVELLNRCPTDNWFACSHIPGSQQDVDQVWFCFGLFSHVFNCCHIMCIIYIYIHVTYCNFLEYVVTKASPTSMKLHDWMAHAFSEVLDASGGPCCWWSTTVRITWRFCSALAFEWQCRFPFPSQLQPAAASWSKAFFAIPEQLQLYHRPIFCHDRQSFKWYQAGSTYLMAVCQKIELTLECV